MFPYVNERMRKRRCFADKELDVAMFEREKRMEAEKIKVSTTANNFIHTAQAQQHLLAQMAPRDFLQRIFPAVNQNVIELVWQGCGGNLERAIEQIASSSTAAAVRQRLAAGAARLNASTPSSSTPELGEITSRAAKRPAISSNSGERSYVPTPHSAFSSPTHLRPVLNPSSVATPNLLLPQTSDRVMLYPPTATAAVAAATLAYQTLLSRGIMPAALQHPFARAPSVPKSSKNDYSEDILSEKSAFHTTSQQRDLHHSDRSSSSRSVSPEVRTEKTVKSPIKFSVESIIGS